MRVYSILWMILCAVGCDAPEPELTVLDKAEILEQIDADPLQSAYLCGQIPEDGQREFCTQYALQAIPKEEVVTIRELCGTLDGNAKGECWFQVAERSLELEDCDKAIPFVEECRIHLALNSLIQSNADTWDKIEQISHAHMLDLTNPKQGTVVYQYWFRSTSQLQLDGCRSMKHPKICLDAIRQLYLQRLKDWDLDPKSSCDSIPEKLDHSDQRILKTSFDQVYARRCGVHK